MRALCAALFCLASLGLGPKGVAHAVEAEAKAEAKAALGQAVWAFAHWQGAVLRLAPDFGLDAPDMVTRFTHEPGAVPGAMQLHAWAAPSGLTLELAGSGWQTPSEKARALLTRNAAHELAHLWQFGFGEAEAAPRWLHEGFAELLSAELTGAPPRAHGLRCAQILRRGPVAEAMAGGQDEAIYDCGAVLIDTVAAGRGESTAELYAQFAEGGFSQDAFLDLADGATPSLGRAARAFLRRDWRHASPSWVMAELRAGRL